MIMLVVVMSLLITGRAVTGSAIIADHSDSGIINTTDGSGEKPFIYRALLPQLANMVTMLTPQAVVQDVGQFALTLWDMPQMRKMYILDDRIGPRQKVPPYDAYKMTVYIVLMYAAYVAYALLLEKLVLEFFPGHALFALIAPVYGLFITVPYIDSDFHGYDFPSLMFCALMLLYMHRQQWNKYLLCLALASLNRETAIFLIGAFFVCYRGQLPKATFARLLFSQAAIWAIIIVAVRLAYIHNPDWPRPERPYVIADEIRNFGSGKMMQLLALWGLLAYRWEQIPRLLKNIAWLLPLNIALYLAVGMFREYRVFFDIFPFITLVTGYSLFHKLDAAKND